MTSFSISLFICLFIYYAAAAAAAATAAAESIQRRLHVHGRRGNNYGLDKGSQLR